MLGVDLSDDSEDDSSCEELKKDTPIFKLKQEHKSILFSIEDLI